MRLTTFVVFVCLLFLFGCGRAMKATNSISTNGNSSLPGNTNNAQPSLAVLVSTEGESFDFGSVTSGATVDHIFNFYNVGSASATAINVTGPASAPFSMTSSCAAGSSLNNGTTACSVTIRFAPTAVGQATGQFSVSYFNGASTVSFSRALRGTGLVAPVGHLSLTVGVLNYGSRTVGSVVDQPFIFTSDGTASVTGFTASNLSGNFAFKSVASIPNSNAVPCANALVMQPGATCFIVISYLPTLPAGLPTQNQTATTNIQFNGGSSLGTISLTVFGTAVANANLAVTLPTISTQVNASAVGCIQVVNNGPQTAMSLTLAALQAPYTASVTTPGCANPVCGADLAAGGRCDFPVLFRPTSAGNFSTPVSLTYGNGSGNVTYSGTISGSASYATVNASVTIRVNNNAANPLNCSYIVDPAGVGRFLGCNNNGGGTYTVPLALNPDATGCNLLRVVMTIGIPGPVPNLFSGVPFSRDTASPAHLPYMYFTRSGNSFSALMNDDNGTTNVNDNNNFADHGWTLTVPAGSRFQIQGTSLGCTS